MKRKFDFEDLKDIKSKAKRMKIDDMLFSGFCSESESESNSSSDGDSDEEGYESTQSKTQSLIKYTEESTFDHFSFKLSKSMNRDSIIPHLGDTDDFPQPFKETEMEFYTHSRLSNLKAAKNLILTRKTVCDIIQKESFEIAESIARLFGKYVELIEFNPFAVKDFLELKYFSHYKKQMNFITVKSEVDGYNEILTNDEISTEDDKADCQRKSFFKNMYKETSRGLPYQHNFYEFYNYPVLFEET